jgi:hypothetical protein
MKPCADAQSEFIKAFLEARTEQPPPAPRAPRPTTLAELEAEHRRWCAEEFEKAEAEYRESLKSIWLETRVNDYIRDTEHTGGKR